MTSKRGNLFEQHVEILVLLGCAGLLGLVAYQYLWQLPVTVTVEGRRLGPEQVDVLVQERAETLKDNLNRKSREAGPDGRPLNLTVTPYSDEFRSLFSEGLFGLYSLNQPRTLAMEWNTAKTPTGTQQIADHNNNPPPVVRLAVLPKILPPTDIQTTAGFSYVVKQAAPAGASKAPAAINPTGTPEETHWVTVNGLLDITAQVAELAAAHYPMNPPGFLLCWYLRVDLERCEVLPDGKKTEPVIIATLPTVKLLETPEFPPGEFNPANPKVKAIMDPMDPNSFSFHVRAKEYQEKVLQPPMYPFMGDGDRWVSPLKGIQKNPALPAPAPMPKSSAQRGSTGVPPVTLLPEAYPPLFQQGQPGQPRRVPPVPQPTAAPMRPPTPVPTPRPTPTPTPARTAPTPTPQPGALPAEVPPPGEGVVNPPAGGGQEGGADNDTLRKVWAHDLTVLPGKTYRYRLRVTMYNRLAGLPIRMLNPADARVIELVSAWSDWSEPVHVPKDVEWFLTGGGGLSGGAATASVFKVLPGDRPLKATFKIEPGQPIGQTVEVVKMTGVANAPKEPVDFATGAVLLEVRAKEPVPVPFSGPMGWTMEDTTVIVYQDADKTVQYRVLRQDRSNPKFRELEARVKAMSSPPK